MVTHFKLGSSNLLICCLIKTSNAPVPTNKAGLDPYLKCNNRLPTKKIIYRAIVKYSTNINIFNLIKWIHSTNSLTVNLMENKTNTCSTAKLVRREIVTGSVNVCSIIIGKFSYYL